MKITMWIDAYIQTLRKITAIIIFYNANLSELLLRIHNGAVCMNMYYYEFANVRAKSNRHLKPIIFIFAAFSQPFEP